MPVDGDSLHLELIANVYNNSLIRTKFSSSDRHTTKEAEKSFQSATETFHCSVE